MPMPSDGLGNGGAAGAGTDVISNSAVPDPQALAAKVLEALEELGDVERREFAKSSSPTPQRVIGIKVPDQRVIENDLIRKLRDAPPASWWNWPRPWLRSGCWSVSGSPTNSSIGTGRPHGRPCLAGGTDRG